MGHGDMANPIPDLYLTWRLEQLIDSGRIELMGDYNNSIRCYEVRRQ